LRVVVDDAITAWVDVRVTAFGVVVKEGVTTVVQVVLIFKVRA
jgi:hypothetical protein